jgi:hypothetical protein
MAFDFARLRSIARGEKAVVTGVTGVTALQSARNAGCNVPVTCDVTCVSYCCNACNACNVSKKHVWEKDASSPSRERGAGVTDGVTGRYKALQDQANDRNRQAALARLTDRFCACGNLAAVAVGRFTASRGNPEGVARWLCQECFDADRDAAG